jgi:alpha-beta hydrolase superfamily lysophospholipase
MADQESPRMTPVAFSGCAGWVHFLPPATGAVGVLLCSGIGEDFTNGYRPSRVLADAIAQSGYVVLRFDYPGIGDSLDVAHPDLWATWQNSVQDAANWLKNTFSLERLILIGVRIGATLAALEAVRRDDVVGLVGIEPVVNVRSFISQLTVQRKLRAASHGGQDHEAHDAGLKIGELSFSEQDIAQMRETDLAKLAFAKPLDVAIFARGSGPRYAVRFDAWVRQEVRLEFFDFAPMEALLRPNHFSGEAEIDPSNVLDWLSRVAPTSAERPIPLFLPEKIATDSWEESTVKFGVDLALAGVVCRPTARSALGVLICNSGGNPHQGFSRFGVLLARRLASAGITSLRFDFSGLGDSVDAKTGRDVQTDVFRDDRAADIDAAIDALDSFGVERFAIHGLCSGAFHAVQAAAANSRISAFVSVNLPGFSLRHEPVGVENTAWRQIRSFADRNIPGLFIFGDGDAGLAQFERQFGPRGTMLADHGNIGLGVSPQLDHDLTEVAMQTFVVNATMEFFRDESIVERKSALDFSVA